MQYSISSMLPMLYTTLTIGREIESQSLKLYQLHSIASHSWVLATLCYLLVLCSINFGIGAIGIIIFNYYIFEDIKSGSLLFLWMLLQSIYAVPTGILLAVLCKRSKQASMTAFFIILILAILQMFQFNSKIFSWILLWLIPC